MAIPTTRTKSAAQIVIHKEMCNGCGLCVTVCKDFSFVMLDNKVVKSDNPMFGCTGCGHCMAICPSGAIEIHGREISPADVFTLPGKEALPSYDQLLALLQRRRSIREFNDTEVDQDVIDKILAAALTAPMGLPPSDVNVLVFKGRDRVNDFARDYSGYLKGMRFMASGWFLSLMRPFWGKENDEMFRGFVKPLFSAYIDEMEKGMNYISYDAPLAIYFYASPYSDPADPIIPATYAMLAAESLGLGTCMLGAIHPMIQSGRKARKFREKYGIRFKSREGLFVIFGYPAVKYKKGIKRSFASITMN